MYENVMARSFTTVQDDSRIFRVTVVFNVSYAEISVYAGLLLIMKIDI